MDNGYLDKLIEFGYLCSPVVFATFVAVLWSGTKLILTTPYKSAMTNIFPLAIWSVVLIVKCYGEQLYDKVLEHCPNVGRSRHNCSAATAGWDGS